MSGREFFRNHDVPEQIMGCEAKQVPSPWLFVLLLIVSYAFPTLIQTETFECLLHPVDL